MSEQMARHKANDNHPANFPEDNGLRLCNECGEHIKVNLMNAKEAEVEEFDSCHSHLKTVEELQEYAFNKGRSIDRLARELKEKNTRILELESRCRYKEGHIEELESQIRTMKDLEEAKFYAEKIAFLKRNKAESVGGL